MRIFATCIACLGFTLNSFSQITSGSSRLHEQEEVGVSIDTTFWEIENKAKSRFWGNSTYISSSINFAKNTAFDFSIGRTNGIATYSGRGLGGFSISSWGFGYSLTNSTPRTNHALNAFYEYCNFPFLIIGNYGFRGEYILDLTNKQHYLRPAVGLTFVYVDIFYNYSFLLDGAKTNNTYRHGLSIRAKYFLHKKNWEKRVFKE